jgi:RNA polymerase sigma factor (TIGR02999 family)
MVAERMSPAAIAKSRTSTSEDVTEWLLSWSRGDQSALVQLMPSVYAELCRLAKSYLRREREGHTLETASLVHEAYLRLVDQRRVQWENRSHFYAVASQLMRRILMDHARRHHSAKRGGDSRRLAIDDLDQLPGASPRRWLELDEALQRLSLLDSTQGQIIEMHFFGGLTHEEIASVLGISVPTVNRRWRMARAWLYRHLTSDGGAIREN